MKRTGQVACAGLAAAIVALLLGVGSADANFPGRNGAIAFDMLVGGSTSQIGLLKPDGSRVSLPRTPGLSEATPRWSPDGTKIAYFAYPSDNREVSDVWVMDANGDHKTQLTNTSVREEVPAWTTDGRIVYCGQDPDTQIWGVYRINADGTGLVNLTNTPAGRFDCWPAPAPHGDRLAFTSWRNDTMQIYTMKLDGTGVRQVTAGDFSSMPEWSPKGNDIAFIRSNSTGDQDVWVVHSDGTNLRRLTNTPGRVETFPSWSPDGSQVIFRGAEGEEGGTGTIYSVDLRTMVERTVASPEPPDSDSLGYPSWQPIPRP